MRYSKSDNYIRESAGIFPKQSGIVPESLLEEKSLDIKSLQKNQDYKLTRRIKFPKDDGMTPEKLFARKSLFMRMHSRLKITATSI